MSNQEAIALLRNLEDALDSWLELNEEGKTAFRMAIEALSCSEIPNNSDCISRQAAIEAINSHFGFNIEEEYGSAVQEVINGLPSAEPERKKGNEKCSNELPCGWCSLFDTPCFGRGGEQDG